MNPRRQAPGSVIRIDGLIDDEKCFQTVRNIRWPNGVRCPVCESQTVIKHGRDETQPARQRYRCNACHRYFDDLTGTVFEGHHQPLKIWMLCLYFMGLNLSNRQIAAELDLNKDDVQQMTRTLRRGITRRKPPVALQGEVECDEVYVVAGHKGHPDAVKKKGAAPDETGSEPPAAGAPSPRKSRPSSGSSNAPGRW